MELFVKDLKAVNYFYKKAPSQIFDWFANTLLQFIKNGRMKEGISLNKIFLFSYFTVC